MKRVVVTGLGMVTPLGLGTKGNWEKLIQGRSGIRKIESFDVSGYACQIAGIVPTGGDYPFAIERFISSKDEKKMDRFIVYALTAAREAIEDAEWFPESDEEKERTGVTIGSGIGGLKTIYEMSTVLNSKGVRKISPFFIPAALINMASGYVSLRYDFRGPNHSVVTACSSGAHAIGDAMRMIQYGHAEVMVAGGAESAINPLGVGGFMSARALSTHFNDSPEAASRPYDRDRDGFVMGEGSGVMVLESLEHAKNRGARIYAEIIGYGLSSDAYHITAPPEDGNGAYRSIRQAVGLAKIAPEDVDYINAHGTSTPLGDIVEVKAIRGFFGDHARSLWMSSTKSSIGHLLGAAGAVEAIYSIYALKEGVAPPTINLENPAPECDGLDLIPHTAKERKIRVVLSNSFGFGGTNVSLIFRRYD